jgi:hypothetical protein
MFELVALAHAEAPEPLPNVPVVFQIQATQDWERNQSIRKRLEVKFKDDKETHPEMWDPNWIKKPN